MLLPEELTCGIISDSFWEHSRILHNAWAEKTALNELFAPEVQNGVLKYHTPKSSLLISVFDLDSPNTVSMKQRSQNCGFLINNKAREQKVRLVSSCNGVFAFWNPKFITSEHNCQPRQILSWMPVRYRLYHTFQFNSKIASQLPSNMAV